VLHAHFEIATQLIWLIKPYAALAAPVTEFDTLAIFNRKNNLNKN
jgi:hypothetical protein